jgi:hypothetical protein
MILAFTNYFKKGQELERKLSIDFHEKSMPLLIEPYILRKRGAGQVDLARIVFEKKQKYIELLEVKCGNEVSIKQNKRLRGAANLIGEVFQLPVRLHYSLRTIRESKISGQK